MKRIWLTILFSVLIASASADENKKIAISLKDRPVFELFEILKKAADMQIVYSKEMLTVAGKPVTINIDLKDVEAGIILEVASRAAGFTYEKKGSIYIILPVMTIYAAPSAPPAPAAPSDDKNSSESEEDTTSENKGEGSVEVVGVKPLPDELTQKRYTGNFMYGHGSKVYLNLVIPPVNSQEEKRITLEMRRILKDGEITVREAQKLFGQGSEISGKDLDRFLKELYKAAIKRLSDDGKLNQKEIHELRNDFINSILNTYEEQQ